jgi:O-antigen/teichoic acid export membrane protein
MFVQRVLSALGWSFALRMGIQVFSWAVTLIVIRLLTPEDYGLMTMALAYLSLAMVWRELGLNSLLIQNRTIEPAEMSRIYGAMIVAHLLLCALLVAAAPPLARLFDDDRLTLVLQALALSLLIMPIASVPRAILQRSLNFKATTTSELISNIASAAVTLSLALLGQGVWALVAGNIVGSIVLSLALYWASPVKVRPRFDLALLRPRLPFMRQTLWSQTLGQVLGPINNFIVGKMLGTASLGFYSMAREIASLPVSKASSILVSVAFPAVSEIQSDPALIRSYFLRAIRVQSALTYPAMFGLAACAVEIVPLVLGEQWRPATFLFAMTCLGTPGRMITVLVPALAFGRGRPDLVVKCLYYALALTVVTLPIGIALGGLDGLAVAVLINLILNNLAHLRVVMGVVGSSAAEVMAQTWVATANAAVMAIGVYALGLAMESSLSPWAMLAAKIALGAAIYLPLALLFDRRSIEIGRLLIQKASGRDKAPENAAQ